MKISLIFVILSLFLVSAFAKSEGNGTCFGGTSDSGETDLLSSACCWYSDDSCCTAASNKTFEFSFDEYYTEFTFGSDTNDTYNDCFAYFEMIECSICAPDNSFVDTDSDSNTVTITVCETFCQNFYSACKDLPLVVQQNFTSSTDFCNFFNDTDDYLIQVSTDGCFNGVELNDVIDAKCNPWDDNGDGGGNSGGWGLYLLFLLIGVAVLAVIIVIIGGVAFFLYKKKQSQTFSTNTTGSDYKDAFDDD